MAVAGSSKERPGWCPPGKSRNVTPPKRPSIQSSPVSSPKRSNSSSYSRHTPSPTTPSSLEPPTKVRKVSNQSSNSQYPRARSSSSTPNDRPVSQSSSLSVNGKLKEPDLDMSQATQSPSTLFSFPKDLFCVQESDQAYEFGFLSGQDALTLGSRLTEEIRMRCQVEDQLAELAAQLNKVSEERDAAQSRANDLKQQLESVIEVQAAQLRELQAPTESKATSFSPEVHPPPVNPEEFTPENYIWVKQQWDRVAEENSKLDNSLHCLVIEKHQLEAEHIGISRELENYQKQSMSHRRSMSDATQQTEGETTQMVTAATQTDFMNWITDKPGHQTSEENKENEALESEHQAVHPQPAMFGLSDAVVQVEEQHDENVLLDDVLRQAGKDSGILKATIRKLKGDKESLEKQLEVCIKQKASGQDSSTQTEGIMGEGVACQTTMAHDNQSSMILRAESLQLLASQIDQENKLVELQRENDFLRRENAEMRSALEQPQHEDSPPKEPQSQLNETQKEQETNSPSPEADAEAENADVEMGGIAQGPNSTTPQDINTENEFPMMPIVPPVTLETTSIIRADLQQVLNNNSRDLRTNSDETRQMRDRRRYERQMRRWQRELERDEEANQPRTHRNNSRQVYKQIKETLSQLAWIRYPNRRGRRTLMDFLPFPRYMFPRRLSYHGR